MSPRTHAEEGEAAEAPADPLAGAPSEQGLFSTAEPEMDRTFFSDLREGLRYLAGQPRVLALGLTYAFMMAGVLSGNVLIAALTMTVLKAGAAGFGFMEAGWAVGAVSGGLLLDRAMKRFPPAVVLILSLLTLSIGHILYPLVSMLAAAVVMQALFGMCRAFAGVLTQSSIMTIVPRRLMGRAQSAFSVIATILQMLMSLVVGVLAEMASLTLAFVVLGLLYGIAVLAALRARAEHERAAPRGA
jgi:MFS family permease